MVLGAFNDEQCITFLTRSLRPTDAGLRLGELRLHYPHFDKQPFKLEGLDIDYCRKTVEESKHCIERGKYRLAGIQHPEKWESFLRAIRLLPEHDRSLEDAARAYKDHLVGDSDWGYGYGPAPVINSTRLGDYYKALHGTITTIDAYGREWEWTENGTGFSDEFPGGKSKSGKFAWQLRDGESTDYPAITWNEHRTPIGQAGNKRVLQWSLTGTPMSDDHAQTRHRQALPKQRLPAQGRISTKPPPPTVEEEEEEEGSEHSRDKYLSSLRKEDHNSSPNSRDPLDASFDSSYALSQEFDGSFDNYGEGSSNTAGV